MKKTTSRRVASLAVVGTVAALSLSACGGSSFNGGSSASSSASGSAASANKNPIRVLIGSSGPAETAAMQSAVAAWSKTSGIPATVTASTSLETDAAKGFSSGKPADVLYASPEEAATWAKAGNLTAYGDSLKNKDDFYPSLTKAFTIDNKLECAPKDMSTLALFINTTMWQKAGLTDADIPTTWDQLDAVGQKIKAKGMVPLTMTPEIARAGAFMTQAGGKFLTDDGQANLNSAENVAGLTEVQKLAKDGTLKFSNTLNNATWGGEAFGKGSAVMAVEGNWLTGSLSKDHPDVKYKAVELPAGKQKGTLAFTNCLAITAKSGNAGGAQSLVEYLTAKDQQLAFAKAFGVIPSIQSAKSDYLAANKTMEPFVNGVDYAQSLPAMPGATDVIKDINQKLPSLATTDSKALLDTEQKNLQAAIAG